LLSCSCVTDVRFTEAINVRSYTLLLSFNSYIRVCAGDKIFAELACFFSCLAFFLIYYFIGQPILTLFMVRSQVCSVLFHYVEASFYPNVQSLSRIRENP